MNAFKTKIKKWFLIGRYPEIDWRKIVYATLLLVIIISVWSISFFFQVKGEDESLASLVGQTVASNGPTKGDQLKTFIEQYQSKENQFQALLANNHMTFTLPTAASAIVATSTLSSTSTKNSAATSSTSPAAKK